MEQVCFTFITDFGSILFKNFFEYFFSFCTIVILVFQIRLSSKIDKQSTALELKSQKIELFKLRISHYQILSSFIHDLIAEATTTRVKISNLSRVRKHCSFLFDTDIVKFIDEVIDNSIILVNIGEDESKESQKKKLELLRWFNDAYEQLESRFNSYLCLSK
ncbi:MAG: hypothetical protein PHE56_03110 [Bacteroidales bacterium]|nr:hypothetical protein [Bacteroidales bacterium]